MAKYRIATLQAETAGTAGTDVIPINIKEPISRIQIKLNILRGSSGMSTHPSADMTKIELVDGSDVLFSMTGAECQALCIYDRESGSMCKGNHINSNGEVSNYGLDFGRFLYDKMLALDPTKFDNLQLKITYTLTTCDTLGASGTIEVRAWVFDEEKITPSGFLMSKEIYSYTCGAENSYEYIDFPLDYPIRKLIFRAYRDDYQPCDQIKEFMIDENTGENIVMQWGTETYLEFMRGGTWVPLYEQVQIFTSGASNFYTTPTNFWCNFMWTNIGTTGKPYCNSYGAGGKFYMVSDAAYSINGVASGYLPNHCFEVRFGDPQIIDDWYDTAGKKQVRLRLKAGSSTTNGTAQVVLQQYRTY